MSRATPPALEALPPTYVPLFHRAVDVLAADERVRAVWLGGSLARCVADAGSDLDLVVAVRDDALEAFRADWPRWLGAIAPTVYARLAPTFLHSVTATCERLDVVIEPVSAVAASPVTYRLAVHDPDGLDALVPAAPPARGPDVAVLRAIAEEFLRMQAIFPAAVVEREDWLLGVVGVQDNQRKLYELFVEANQPLPVMGVKQWSARLTPEQREVLLSLPVPGPDRAELVAAQRATQHAWRTAGRATLEAAGGEWPVAMDDAVIAYWARVLPP